ncbi:MAG: heavy metal transporter, partial [Nostoc sp.]
DRIAILEFKKTFVDNPDPNNPREIKGDPRFRYDQDFIRTHVAPAFLNRMLQALKDLIESGIDYECTTDAFYNLQKENNHLFDFIEDEKLGYVEGGEISANDLWFLMENWYKQNDTLTIDENGRRTWVDQVRPSDKNVKGVNQVIARIIQLFPKAVKASRYCDVRKKQIPILKGIGILPVTRPSLEETRPTSAPLPAPEIGLQQDFRPTRPTFSEFEKNIENEVVLCQTESFSSPMQNQENVTQTGAGIAEPLQNKEKQEDNWGGTGAGSSKTGAGIPTEHEAVTATTITSETTLAEAENDNSYSLLQVEKDDQDVIDYVGRQVEVREGNGSVKFAGEIVECDVRNAIVSVMTEQGNRDAYFSEAFVID